MLVKVYGAATLGVDAHVITVEVNIDKGVGYHLVGLPDNAVKESNYRIQAALKNVGYKLPGKKIIINMAPADQRKEGTAYDLTLAIGILVASNQIKAENLVDYMIMGELSLDGEVQPIKGVLPIAIKAKSLGFKGVILPKVNAKEAAIVSDISILGVQNITEVIAFFNENKQIRPTKIDTRALFKVSTANLPFDFSEVKGHLKVKRALEIAAAGGHNVILVGPPGSGKSMLAKRIATILPPLSLSEALETTKIYSVAGRLKKKQEGLITERPFRSPHHTISDVALVGGGGYPQPGEISLAHNGVLFLDEMPEFKRSVLEVLRQPLEDREVTISRAKFTVTYASSLMLIASMNPSPSGFFPDDPQNTSSVLEMQRYKNKISGPLLDRIDLHIEVNVVPFEQLASAEKGESSASIRERVIKARMIQTERYVSIKEIHYNAQITPKYLRTFCALNESTKELLKNAMERLKLSARAYNRILKVARTIADLEVSSNIERKHVAEAIQYRNLDREGWM